MPEIPDRSILRPTWIEVDVGALAHNAGEIRRLIGRDRRLIGVVKANAFGAGLETVPTLVEHGVDVIAVGDLQDAIDLRRGGCEAPILLFGSCLPHEVAETVAEWDVTPTVWDVEGAAAYAEAAHKPMNVFLKIETGAHRFGAQPSIAPELARRINALPNLHIDHVFTSFSDPGGDPAFLRAQYDTFVATVEAIRAAGVPFRDASCAASTAIALHPETYLSAVRSARLLYGLYWRPEPRVELDIQPVVTAAKSRLIYVATLPAGGSLGYARAFVAERETRYGVFPCGWKDGLFLRGYHDAQVLVRGRRCPVIGIVNSEHCTVDLTDLEGGADPVDEVVLWGTQGDEAISVTEHASWGEQDELAAIVHLGRTLPHVVLQAPVLGEA